MFVTWISWDNLSSFSECVSIIVLKRNARMRVTFINEVLTRFIALARLQKGWTVEGGGRFTENFLGLLTHIEEQGSLQLDPPAPWLVKICTDLHSCSADWCVLVRYPFGKACIKAQ